MGRLPFGKTAFGFHRSMKPLNLAFVRLWGGAVSFTRKFFTRIRTPARAVSSGPSERTRIPPVSCPSFTVFFLELV